MTPIPFIFSLMLLVAPTTREKPTVETFHFADRGDLQLTLPPGWSASIHPVIPEIIVITTPRKRPTTAPATADEVAAAAGRVVTFDVHLTVDLPSNKDKDLESLQKALRASTGLYLELATEKEVSLIELKGPAASGYYFTLTMRKPTPFADCFTVGCINTGDMGLSFAIFHETKSPPQLKEALGIIRSVHKSPASTTAPATPARE